MISSDLKLWDNQTMSLIIIIIIYYIYENDFFIFRLIVNYYPSTLKYILNCVAWKRGLLRGKKSHSISLLKKFYVLLVEFIDLSKNVWLRVTYEFKPLVNRSFLLIPLLESMIGIYIQPCMFNGQAGKVENQFSPIFPARCLFWTPS